MNFGEARVAHLATVDARGRPRVVPCCFALAGDVVYTAIDDVKPKSTLALRRVDDVRAHPDVALVVDQYDDTDWSQLWWVRARGTARVVDDDAERARALELLAAKYAQYAEHPPPGDVIAIEITDWKSWSAT